MLKLSKLLWFSFSKIDIYLGIFEGNIETSKYLIASRAYHQNSLTWCVQKKKQIPVHLLLLHLSIDPLVFLGLTFTLVLVVDFGYFMQQFEPRQKWDYFKIVTSGVCLFMGSPSPYKPENNAHRLAYTFILFGGIIYMTTITTLVVNLFTSSTYYPQIQTVEEILSNNFSLVGKKFALQKLLQQNEVILKKINVKK